MQDFLRRHFRWLLLGCVLLGLLLRIGVGLQLRAAYPPVTQPSDQTDMGTYMRMAREVVTGAYDYGEGFYYQPFYNQVFLPAVYALFGTDPQSGSLGLVLAQGLLGAACAAFVGLGFARLGGRLAGLLGALLTALCQAHIFYTPFALIAILQSFWLSLLAYLCVLGWTQRGWAAYSAWGGAALVLGLGNATRGNMILLLPILLALLLYRHRHQPALAGGLTAATLVLMYLPQLPFALVNYQVHGEWVGPSSAGPAVLALGNTPEAPPGGRDPGTGPGPMAYPPAYGEWLRQEDLPDDARTSVPANMWHWLRREPLAFLELKLRMFLLFWHHEEIPNNVAMVHPARDGGTQGSPSSLLHLPVLAPSLLVSGLGLAGMLLGLARLRRRPALGALALLALGYCLSIVLFYILTRFRVPVLPLLCGLGGYALAMLWRRWQLYRRARDPEHRSALLLVAATILLGLTVSAFAFPAYRYAWEPTALRIVRPHGVQLELADRWTLKDRGPRQFGGWQPVPANPGILLRKAFVAARPDPLPAEGPVALHLPVYAERPAARIELGSGRRKHAQTLDPSLQTVRYRLSESEAAVVREQLREQGAASLAVAVRATPGVHLFVDTQRDYGRSDLPPDLALGGEWVVTLELYKEGEAP